MTVKSSVISSDVEELFIQRKQLKWEDFSSSIDRVNYLTSEIERAYVPSVGIQAADLCRILYAYFPARKVYEGIAYHLFNLVATKDGKGHVFFIKKSDIGTSTFPVIPSIWHSLDTVVEEEGSSSEIAEARSSLESQWDNNSDVKKSELSSALSSMLKICSKISDLLSKLG